MPHVNDAPDGDQLRQQAAIVDELKRITDEQKQLEQELEDMVIAARASGLSWHSIGQAMGKNSRYMSEKYSAVVRSVLS